LTQGEARGCHEYGFQHQAGGGIGCRDICRTCVWRSAEAVPTQLPPDKTVTAPDASVQARINPQAETDRLSKQVIIDRAAAEIVYRTVDSATSLVIRQYPDEARLRARAYLRAMDIAREDNMRRNTDLRI